MKNIKKPYKKLSLSDQIKLVQDYGDNGDPKNIINHYDRLIEYVIKKTLLKYLFDYDKEFLMNIKCNVYSALFKNGKILIWDPYYYKKRSIKKKSRTLGSWIGMITKHKTIDYLKSVDIYIKAPPRTVNYYCDDNYYEVVSLDNPEDQFKAKLILLKIFEYIKNMKPGKKKEIMELSVINGENVEVIAKKMNLPKKSISEIKSREIKKLKESIEDC